MSSIKKILHVYNVLLVLLIVISNKRIVSSKIKPHIILIFVDDMGYNDVSYHGSDQIPTPNIDALAYYGIALNKFYTAPMCTPSRAALMTGKYPIKLGMQHMVISGEEPWGLDINEKLLPEYLRDGGYNTHLIGKWHLGFYKKEYTPTFRGFDSHFGYLGPYIDYWDHSMFITKKPIIPCSISHCYTILLIHPQIAIFLYKDAPFKLQRGLDMRNNLTINYNTNGTYATDLFTDYAVKTLNEHNKSEPLFMYLSHLAPHSGNEDDPLQAHALDIAEFNYIKDTNRRIYAAMVSRLDRGVGRVMEALRNNTMLNNTIVLFISDNGAPSAGLLANYGSNFPLRGQKNSPWEGAVRTNAIIWSAQLKQKQHVSNQLFHITDIFKTLVDFANVSIPTDRKLDGTNIWNAISNNEESPRNEVLCNYDADVPYGSLIYKNWKYIYGTTNKGKFDKWLGILNRSELHPSTLKYEQNVFNSKTSLILLPYSYNISEENYKSWFHQLRTQATVVCLSPPKRNRCNPLKRTCLFNLDNDPCERDNIAKRNRNIKKILQTKLLKYSTMSIPPRNKPSGPVSNPRFFNNTWTWWFDELNITDYFNKNIS